MKSLQGMRNYLCRFIYNPKSGRIYFIPITVFPSNSKINLRLLPCKNNQEKNIIWASEFEDTDILKK